MNRKNKERVDILNKKIKILSIIFGLLFSLAVVTFFTVHSKSKNTESVFISLNSQDFSSSLNEKKDIWVYIGRSTCEECRDFSPVLERVLKENKKQVYYYDIDLEREKDEIEMLEILDILDIKVVPAVIHLEEGKITKESVGYQNKEEVEKLFEF